MATKRRLSLPLVRRLIVIGLLMLAVLLVGTGGKIPSVHAASSSESSACSIYLVHLNGQHPATITCLRHGSVPPNIYGDYCSDIYNLTAEIRTSSMGNWCYAGTGYTGLNPNLRNVTAVYGWNCSWGWILHYEGGAGQKAYFNDNGVYSGKQPPYNDVTQLDVTSGYGC